jgi:putative transposase
VHAELWARGKSVSRRRVARLMRKRGPEARKKRRFRRTTDSDHAQPIAPNLLDRNFIAVAPNQKWVTDITYIRTWEGWLFLATVLDLFSRRIVGWAIADHLRTELVLDALKFALGRRLPEDGLVHHSDRGSQYASEDYRQALRDAGIACSMSRKGNCWDNAVAESFFSTLKLELVYRQPWPTRATAKAAVIEWIEVFYNTKRRHSHLGYRTPAEEEKLFHTNPEKLQLAA